MGPIMSLIHDSYNVIKNPERWTQNFYQKDINGKNCKWREGYSFCALGILNFLQDEDSAYHGAVCILQRHSEKMFNGQDIQTVNDCEPCAVAHQNVMRVYESVMAKFVDRDPTEEEWTAGLWQKVQLEKLRADGVRAIMK